MKKLTILLVGFLTFQFVFAQDAPEITQEKHETENFSITFPSDWTLDQSRTMNTEFILFSPLNNPVDVFRENVNLLMTDMSEYNMTMDDIVKLSEEQIATLITEAKVIQSVRRQKDGMEYHFFEYTGKQGTYNLRFLQHFYLKDGMGYVLTFSAETKSFADFEKTGNNILNSFKVK